MRWRLNERTLIILACIDLKINCAQETFGLIYRFRHMNHIYAVKYLRTTQHANPLLKATKPGSKSERQH